MNKNLAENFQILAEYNSKIGEIHRARAYKTVTMLLKNFPDKITTINQVKGIRNIGKKSLTKIQEYLDTGKIAEAIRAKEALSELAKTQPAKKSEKQEILDIFTSVWGIGPAKAEDLYKAGMKTLSDLRKNKHLLTKNQEIGLHYYKDLIRPIPREYLDILRLGIMYILTFSFGKTFEMEVCGSFRRKAEVSGDLDILLSSTKFTLKDVVRVLTEWKVIVETLAVKNEKFMGIGHCPEGSTCQYIRIDIEFVPLDQFGASLLYFTGSANYGKRIRFTAKQQGYLLNQHGLFDRNTGKRVPVYTEKEILEFIGLEYIEPEYR